mmetsp:Transcript_54220/g.117203  ORF Transcript_54220/g.117203 Transcript_54220/m.117203 type:complete len:359 (-) Transcript_54220:216-1292(-)
MPVEKAPRVMGRAIQAAVKTLAAQGELLPDAASEAMKELMKGEATPAQTGAFLALLSLDKCTPGIVHALAAEMRSNALPVSLAAGGSPTVDIVGTGGDGQDTFNISTTAGILAAAAGARVVKHGNRASSSTSGAADVLEALGCKLELEPKSVDPLLAECNFTFLFARTYHPAMRFVGPVRQELAIRTVFNILGPLTNPAKPDCMVCGVFSLTLGELFVEVFKMLGMRRALVVHGLETLDELSIEGPSRIWELKVGGEISVYDVKPEDFGVPSHPLKEVSGRSAAENAAEMRELFTGGGRPAVRDMVLMNAAAALYITDHAADFKAGTAMAREAMSNGKATKTLEAYVAASQRLAPAAP